MTDSELLQLIEESSPEELTDEQVTLLRQRLLESAELRRAMREQLRFEQWLGDGLGQVQVSGTLILQAAEHIAAKQTRRRWFLTVGIVAAAVSLAVWIMVAIRPPADPEAERNRTQLANGSDTSNDTDPSRTRKASSNGQAADAETTNDGTSATTSLVDGDTSNDVRPPTRPTAPSVRDRDWPELAPGASINRPFEQVCFDEFGTRGVSLSQLQRWLEPVAGGERSRLVEGSGRRGRTRLSTTSLEGLLKLKAPWPADAVLRFVPFDHDGLSLHFWNGDDGVTLRYYNHPRPTWAAFVTQRRDAAPRPDNFELAATDDGRLARIGSGTLDVRHQDGTLILSRGNVQLLAAPLAEPPEEVYFDRRATLRGFTMFRGPRFPNELEPERPLVLRGDQPSSLNWVTRLPEGTAFENRSDEAVTLRADRHADVCRAALPLPGSGLFEVTFHVEDASPGTGVFLGDAEGRPVHTLVFQRDPRTGQVGFGLRSLDEAAAPGRFEAPLEPAPVVGSGVWLRLVLGTGSLKCWISGDGEHWSRAIDPRPVVLRPYLHVGLACARTDTDRAITLRECSVRELDGITSLAEAALLEKVPASVTAAAPDLLRWTNEVRASRPADVDASTWRTACELRTLAAAPPPAVAATLLDGIVSDHLTPALPLPRRIRMLHDAAILADTWSLADGQRFLRHYERLAKSLIREGDSRPFRDVHAALASAPIWCDGRIDIAPGWLARHGLLQLMFRDRWPEALELSQQLRFWNDSGRLDDPWPENQRRLQDLVGWVAANASQRLPSSTAPPDAPADSRDATPLAASWRQPLLLEFSKEAYNTAAEILAATAEKSFDDAGSIITSAAQSDRDLSGLIPDPRDDQLLVSYPRAVANLMLDHPELQQTLIDRFDGLGQLRVQEAIANNDEAAARAVVLEFPGTAAAATAHGWLGDRALSGGEFAVATREFRLAARAGDPALANSMRARERLASAFLGRTDLPAAGDSTTLGDLSLSTSEFAALIAEIQNRMRSERTNVSPTTGHAVGSAATTTWAEPAAVKTGRRLAWETGPHEFGSVPGASVDWIARQTAWTVAESQLITANRRQVAAYDLSTGDLKWTHVGDVNAAKSSRWPLVVQRPLAIGGRVLVRRLAKDGPILVCLDVASGSVVWSTRPGVAVVSDPVQIDGSLRAVTSEPAAQDLIQLELSAVDLATGELTSRQRLIQFRDVWDRQVPCQISPLDDGVMVVSGGCAWRCDAEGNIVWLRRQKWIPAAVDPTSWEQSRDVPLMDGSRVLLTQPGVFSLDCVNAESGRLIWQRVLPELRRVIGLAEGRLLIQTADGLQAIDMNTSETVWERDGMQLDAVLVRKPARVLAAEREPMANGQARPKLVWLELATGHEVGSAPLADLTDKQPCLAPLVLLSDRLWVIFGRGPLGPGRELLELLR
jgi:outer membrane protein assembly factor BamB